MDFDLSEDQQAILGAVEALLEQHCHPARSIELLDQGEYDRELDSALTEAGFYELALGPDTGLLEAVILTEAIARAGGLVTAGASAIVAPALTGRVLPGPIVLTRRAATHAVRFAQHARSILLDDGEEARLVGGIPGAAQPLRTHFMIPLGRFSEAPSTGEGLGPGSGEKLRTLWRLALSAEALGAMSGAFQRTLDYIKQRRQFGRALGSFQAIQHRMAQCFILLEGGRWLTYEAAAKGGLPEACALAATHVLTTADRVFREMHQFNGAMGFTDDQQLHVWTMPLQALRLELAGPRSHAHEATRLRWAADDPLHLRGPIPSEEGAVPSRTR